MSRQHLVAIAVAVFYLGGTALAFWCPFDWTARQTIVVWLTGCVVIWYTWETMQLRDTAARQREQALRPFVLVRHELNHTFVENLGQAPALGVSIGDLTFGDEEHRLGIRFPKQVPVLRAGERLPIEAVSTYNDRAIENVSAVVHLIPRYATFSLDLHITFRSIEGKTFSLVQTTEPNLEVIHGFREASDRSSRSRR